MITIVLTLHNDDQYRAGDWTASYTMSPIALVRALRLWSSLNITIHRIYAREAA